MTTAPDTKPRTALLAGATGLVGSALLTLLRASPRYRHVDVLLRRAVPGLATEARLSTHPTRTRCTFAGAGWLTSCWAKSDGTL